MKKILLIFVIILFVLGAAFVGYGLYENEPMGQTEIKEFVDEKIKVEVGTVEMKVENTGRAEVTVTYPDFSTIKIKGHNEKAYTKSMKKQLNSSKCKMISNKIMVDVTVKDGKQIVDYDEQVNELLERSLIQMINNNTGE